MTDLNEIMKQAKQMQEQFQSAQEELAAITVEGESGAGLVKVIMNIDLILYQLKLIVGLKTI